MSRTNAKQAEIAAISWSGGKDCNLACLYAMRDPNLDVKYLICFKPEGRLFRAHPISIMEEQARCTGLELLFVTIPMDCDDYMQAYVDGLQKIRNEHNIRIIVTGDMDLVGTMEKGWIERCCEKAGGMRSYLPLWKKDRREVLDSFLNEGFQATFTCVKSPFFDASWIGRELNQKALEEMQLIADEGQKIGLEKPLDLAGERGEYHTMVIDGPLYKKRVEFETNEEPLREELKKTEWKGNIHNADIIWTISLKSDE